MLSRRSFAEEGVEGIILFTGSQVRWHPAIRVNAMLQAVELPALVTNLDTTLSQMDGDDLTHDERVEWERKSKTTRTGKGTEGSDLSRQEGWF
mmetsp:Transcript_16162/g.37230  ORF Transcript_16162/g.37230 Transcript_16162/m.37230 type:complete len:93 (-) Transcript_16162:19-297(-)